MFSFFEPRTCNDAMRELLLASRAGKPLSADQIGDAIGSAIFARAYNSLDRDSR